LSVVPFSQALRERTWSSHGESEGAGFMHDLMSGKGTREDYVALVVQHYYVYEALESAAAVFADNAEAQPFLSDQLTRMPALEADLAFLLGDDWRDQISPLPVTEEYAARIREIADEGWAGGYIAHHYTRYMGDLSGGQAIGRLMKRHFGFETNGILFYLFDQIADPKAFKETYREQLDAAGWDEEERDRVIDEVVLAYRFNTETFEDLSAAKSAA
jgi:heme oxygenase